MIAGKPKFLTKVKGRMPARHLGARTVQAYAGWIVRHIRYHGTRQPSEMGERVVVACLTSRLEDPDVARQDIGVRCGTGDKDRVTMFGPSSRARGWTCFWSGCALHALDGVEGDAASRRCGGNRETCDLPHAPVFTRDALKGGTGR